MHKATLYHKQVPARSGPPLIRYYASMPYWDEDEGKFATIDKRCDEIAIDMLDRHVELGSRKREKAWDMVTCTIEDALHPAAILGCSAAEQETALGWFGTEDGEYCLEIIGLDPEYTRWVIATLTEGDNG